MEEILVTRINAGGAARKIDYNALANLPTSDKTLEVDGGFADAKEVGDRLKNISESIVNASLSGLGVEATAAELNYMKGVTSNVQEQLNAKQDIIDDLAVDKVLVSNADGKVGVSTVTATELGHLIGAQDNIQRQISNLAAHTMGDIFALSIRPVNNNILINSNFANPVNQRNIYDAEGYGAYTIDRWKGAAVHLEMTSGYMTMSDYGDSEQSPVIVQRIDHPQYYSNAQLTASLEYAVRNYTDTTKAMLQLQVDSAEEPLGNVDLICDGEWHIAKLPVETSEITEDLRFSILLHDNNASLDLKWAKLEVGGGATPYVPRLYGEELQLCQMYYQTFDVTNGSTRGIDGNEFHFYVAVPQTMRIASPDIITDGLTINCCNLDVGGTMAIEGAYIGSDSTAVNTFTNKLFLQCCLPENHSITVGHHPYVEGVVILDAEI